jgi:hypothetical protein
MARPEGSDVGMMKLSLIDKVLSNSMLSPGASDDISTNRTSSSESGDDTPHERGVK